MLKSKNPYLSDITKLSILQRRILVYSIAYYELNETIVPDAVYEKFSRQYIEMAKKVSKEELRKTDYYYVFYDYDGSTGFDLMYRLLEEEKQKLATIASFVLSRKGEVPNG